MKVNVQHKDIPAGGKLKYPILMRWHNANGAPPDENTLIVLFTAPTIGLALGDGGFCKSAGGWEPATAKCWVPFEGTLAFTG